MLVIDELVKHYGKTTVLDRARGSFAEHQVHFLMGPNGAGKTTLIRSVLGLHRYSGTITWRDRPIDPSERLVFPVFDDAPFHPRLTGTQNLRVLAPEAANQRYRYLTESVLKSKVSGYSHGQRMRLALTLAFNSGAELIVLDEPTNGLDREAMAQLRNDILDVLPTTTFLVTGHNLEYFEGLVDTLHIIKDGTLIDLTADLAETKGGDSLARTYQEHFSSGQ